MYKKTVLLVLEGFGIKDNGFKNPVDVAKMPNWSNILEKNPSTIIKVIDTKEEKSSYEPSSNLSYLNFGACKDVINDTIKINEMIENGSFFSNKVLQRVYDETKENNKSIHLVGMLSKSGVHSQVRHLYALLELAKRKDIDNVYIHVILNGLEGNSKIGIELLEELNSVINSKNIGKVATIIGRHYAMNTTNNYDLTKVFYDLLVNNKGKEVVDYISEVEEQYMQNKNDKEIEPIVVTNMKKEPIFKINEDDAIIFFNFKKEGVFQILNAFSNPYFDEFETSSMSNNLVTMTNVDPEFNVDSVIKDDIFLVEDSFVKIVEEKDIKVKMIYDFIRKTTLEQDFLCNSNILNKENEENTNFKNIITNKKSVKEYLENIDRTIINQANIIKSEIAKDDYDLIVADFCHLDIVGHTGNYNLAIETLESIDKALGIIQNAILENNCNLIITSTNGNIEELIDEKTGDLVCGNTKNFVPFVVINSGINYKLGIGKISQVIPTVLELMGIKPYEKMENSLLDK